MSQQEDYLKVALPRARKFSEALDMKADLASMLRVFILTGDCEQTLRAALIVEKGGQIRTIFRPAKFKNAGTDLAAVKAKMFAPGDGRVTRCSALAISHNGLSRERELLGLLPSQSLVAKFMVICRTTSRFRIMS